MLENGVWTVVRDEQGLVTNREEYHRELQPVYHNTRTEMYHYIGAWRRFVDPESLARVVPDHA